MMRRDVISDGGFCLYIVAVDTCFLTGRRCLVFRGVAERNSDFLIFLI